MEDFYLRVNYGAQFMKAFQSFYLYLLVISESNSSKKLTRTSHDVKLDLVRVIARP